MSRPPLDHTFYPGIRTADRSAPAWMTATTSSCKTSPGIVHVLLDGPHRHPLVLGEARSALYAGDLTVEDGEIVDITNLSGTFRFEESKGLLAVVDRLEREGFEVRPGAVRFFPVDGSRPTVIR